MRKQQLNRARGDEGAVAVLAAILAVVLIGLSAFAVDFGNAYATNRTLSTAADGAALAAAQTLGQSGVACGPTAPAAGAARTVADNYSSTRNAPGSTLLSGNAGFELRCDALDHNGLVTVRNTKTVPFTFGNLFGLSSVNPQGIATAKYGQARTVTGLRPFGLCASSPEVMTLLAQGAPGATPATVRLTVEKTTGKGGGPPGPCGGAPGNWGTLDLNGGSNGTPDTRKWILMGFQGVLDLVGQALPGDPGGPGGGSYETEMNAIVGQEIALPVYDRITGTGANAKFHITRYVSATLCGWKFGNKLDPRTSPCGLTPHAPNGANNPDYLELRFKDSFTVGDFAVCPVAGCALDSGVIALSLVETP